MRNVLGLVLLGLVACSSSEPTSQPTATAAAPELARAATWTVHRNAAGIVTHMEGRSAPYLGEPVEAALTFLTDTRETLALAAPRAQLRVLRVKQDELAMTHVRFAQVERGVPVLGAEMLVHFAPNGAVLTVDSTHHADLPHVDVSPALTATQAGAAASAHFRAHRPGGTEGDAGKPETEVSLPELVIFVPEGHQELATLAYHFEVRDDRLDSMARVDYTVDAHTGAVLSAYDNLQTVAATGKGALGDTKTFQVTQQGTSYVMLDTTRVPAGIRTYTAANAQSLPGNAVTSTTLNNAWDNTAPAAPGSAVDAHAFAGAVYDFYKNALARNAIDGQNGQIISTVHYGTRFNNAFWNGRQMVYGDGDNQIFRSLAAGADVVAHELTHGVTQNESALQYQNQSGALNEAMSDIFGALVENAIAPDPVKNWQVGEAVGVGGPLRNMAHPAQVNRMPQPTHMAEYLNTTQDNGGVHINSGIVNNAAFLMIQGGMNDRSKMLVPRGLGATKGAKLWYRVNSQYLMSTSNFKAAADATQTAAKDLAFTEDEMGLIECAWKAVGVLPGVCNVQTTPATPDAGEASSSGGSSGGGTKTDGGAGGAPTQDPSLGADEPAGDGCATATGDHRPNGALLFGFAVGLGLLATRRRRVR